MSEFERLGDLMLGAGGTRRKAIRPRGVGKDTSSVQQQRQQQPAREEKRIEKVVPFSRQARSSIHQKERTDPGPYRPQGVCPMCKGAGWLRKDVPYGHPDFGTRSPCACKLQERREKQRQKMLALSEQFGFQHDQLLSTFQWRVKGVQDAFQEAKAMITQLQSRQQREDVAYPERRAPALNEWLVFCGPPGTGKTHLAMSITNAGIDAGLVALFAIVPDLLDYLRATYNPESPVTYDELFTQLKEVELLVLDDLGTQRSSSWANEKLFELLNYRYNRKLLTVITLNEQAWDYLDDRMSSRLQDKGLVHIVDMDEAQDYRLRAERNTSRQCVPGT